MATPTSHGGRSAPSVDELPVPQFDSHQRSEPHRMVGAAHVRGHELTHVVRL